MSNSIDELQKEIIQKCSSLAIDMDMLPLAFELLSKTLNNDALDLKTLLLLSNAYLKNNSFINVIHLLINAINSKSKIILNSILVWQKLALSYYRLNRFDDSNHAITYALSIFEKTPRYMNAMNMSDKQTQTEVQSTDSTLEESSSDHGSSETDPSVLNAERLGEVQKLDEELHTPSLSEQKLYVLRCRILLLMDTKLSNIGEILPIFDKCLMFLEKIGNTDFYLDVLITRAQFFKKFNHTSNCRTDLTYILRTLHDNKDNIPLESLLYKVSFSYHFLASIIYEERPNRLDEPMSLIKEGSDNFPHMISSVKRLTLLQSQLIYLSGTEEQLNETIKRLMAEASLKNQKFQLSTTYYMIARLLLKQNKTENSSVAYDYYQKALKLTPNKPWIWISTAALFMELGQFNDALSTYTQAVNRSLYNDESQNEKSEKSFSDESSESSSSSVQNTLLSSYEIKFNNIFAAIAWFGISQVYTATGDYKNATDALNQSLKLFKIEKDMEHVNQLKTLLSKLIVLEADTVEHGTLGNLNAKSSTLSEKITEIENSEMDVSNSPVQEGSNDEGNMKYDKPDVPVPVLIEFSNYSDEMIFRPVEDISYEDICSIKVGKDTVMADTPEEVDSGNGEVIDLTKGNDIPSLHQQKRVRNWNEESRPEHYSPETFKSRHLSTSSQYQGTLPVHYPSHIGPTPPDLPSNINHNYFKSQSTSSRFDPRYQYLPSNSSGNLESTNIYADTDSNNGVLSQYAPSQYSLPSHMTPLNTKSQIISMPVFVPDPRRSLPVSTNATPILHYTQTNPDYGGGYPGNINQNVHVQQNTHFQNLGGHNQAPIPFNNLPQAPGIQPISNQLPTLVPYIQGQVSQNFPPGNNPSTTEYKGEIGNNNHRTGMPHNVALANIPHPQNHTYNSDPNNMPPHQLYYK